MCGIVGLYLRTEALQPSLGALLTTMLEAMTERGPDSAGVAVYENDPLGRTKFSLRAPRPGFDWDGLAATLRADLGHDVEVRRTADDAVLATAAPSQGVLAGIAAAAPRVHVVSFGRAVEVFKDVGAPKAICERYGIPARSGYQGVGHTRMATESAVTTEHSHPFSPAADLCLVHNGSFSNYFSVRRDLEQEGVRFVTDNDSEVAARLIALEMSRGADLGDALRVLAKTMDGFYTLLVSTADQFAVVRDPFACKPAVIAETDDYVAMTSEYRALAELPGIEKARVFEPMPEEIHLWP